MKTSGVMAEFQGGALAGVFIHEADWPEGKAEPGTEVVDKPSGHLYRFPHGASTTGAPSRMTSARPGAIA